MKVLKFNEFLLESRKVNLGKINERKSVLFRHCTKIYIFANDRSVSHWMDEISDYLKIMNKAKDNKKHKYDTYWNNLTFHVYDEYGDVNTIEYNKTEKIFNDVLTDPKYSKVYVVNTNFEEFYNMYEAFIKRVIPLLESPADVKKDTTNEIIDDIFILD